MAKQAAERDSPCLTPGDWLSIVAVVGLLAVVGVPAFLRARNAVTDSACDANRLLLVSAFQRYHQRTDGAVRPGEIDDALVEKLVTLGYLRGIPHDPADGKKYRVSLRVEGGSPQLYVICPEGTHSHGSDHAPLDASAKTSPSSP